MYIHTPRSSFPNFFINKLKHKSHKTYFKHECIGPVITERSIPYTDHSAHFDIKGCDHLAGGAAVRLKLLKCSRYCMTVSVGV